MMTLLVCLVLGILAISGALHSSLSKRGSKSALAWVAFCLLLPLLGPVTYSSGSIAPHPERTAATG
ncbi:MAG TPA: hypothetical protein EYO00_04615 [Gammaproteobacteria bacterium]|nr:hypothetical protein [Gammaproteobacteria bacterium]HIA59154.1 hypothetical protein [Gammaproteobacteria bacterium]HIF85795.1 hypothetical protein [Gammaproteobacteria bacterium]HIL63700.1 hypothetical protein [Porticoccaceae bacterium]HIN90226.1 hypothetical protein [Porticoccaceae bacterium]